MATGASPFYSLRDLHEAQDDPVQYDQGVSGPPLDASRFSVLPGTGLDADLTAGLPEPQPGGLPSLADTEQAAAPPPEDLLSRFQRYREVADAMVQPLLKPYMAEPPRPSVAAQILSFGLAGLDAARFRDDYNRGVDARNAKLKERALELAQNLMKADSDRELANRNYDLNVIRTDIAATNLRASEAQRQMALELTRFRLRTGGLKQGPPSESEQAAAGDMGMRYIPADVPGYFRLVPADAGGPETGAAGATPPAPGSPVANALDPRTSATSGPAPTTAPASSGGLRTSEKLRQEKIAARESATTSSTKTMREAAPKVIHFVDRIEDDLRKVATGPMASRFQEFATGTVGLKNPGFTRYRTNVGLLLTLLMRMHVGARGGEYIMQHFEHLLNSSVQSPENMRASLDEIRTYAQDVMGKPEGSEVSAPGITKAPGADFQTTPGGVRFRVVE